MIGVLPYAQRCKAKRDEAGETKESCCARHPQAHHEVTVIVISVGRIAECATEQALPPGGFRPAGPGVALRHTVLIVPLLHSYGVIVRGTLAVIARFSDCARSEWSEVSCSLPSSCAILALLRTLRPASVPL